VDLVPNRTYEGTFSPGSNFNVTVPSEIPPGEWQTVILDVDNSTVVEAVRDAGGGVEFEFNASDGDYTVSCAPVGLMMVGYKNEVVFPVVSIGSTSKGSDA
jgi:hypothetical protein